MVCFGSASAAAPGTPPGEAHALEATASPVGGFPLTMTGLAPAAELDTVTVVAVGDIACDPEHRNFLGGMGHDHECKQALTAELAATFDPGAVVALGDLQYSDGTYEEYMASYHASWGRFNDVLFPVLGNHEYDTPDAAGYFRYLGEQGVLSRLPETASDPDLGYYAVDLNEHWRLLVLNSECDVVAGGCAEGSPQYEWFHNQLDEAADMCTLIALHRPRFNTGENGPTNSLGALFAVAQSHAADVMLAGHEHRYERFGALGPDGQRNDEDGLPVFIVGTGGEMLYGDSEPHPASEARVIEEFGVLRLVLHEDRFDFSFHTGDGLEGEDAGTIACRSED